MELGVGKLQACAVPTPGSDSRVRAKTCHEKEREQLAARIEKLITPL